MTTNRLIDEKSPYLLQHAHNPVNWYAWGEEAFQKAREEDKPIFLSVGYSTCHWCHVMERESFENEEIAAILNRSFISIKVDREERPDVDRIYMMFVQATTGSGGWPMSVWLTPDLKPFFGGTYFPPDSRYGRPGFGAVLQHLAKAWVEQRAEILKSGESVSAELGRATRVETTGTVLNPDLLDSVFAYFRRSYDAHYGGFGGAPKFPRPSVFQFLTRYAKRTGNDEALEMTFETLRHMAKGGMNDQLGGGFHRYSVDARWFVPHFEKMLYDQAQLAVSYLEAYQISGDPEFAAIAQQTLDYVLRDMTHPEGGFYSAEDADSVIDPADPKQKGEGAFYIWSFAELEQLLGAERAEWFAALYGCGRDGNVAEDPHDEFRGKNILYQAKPLENVARQFGKDQVELETELEEAKRILLEARGKRVRPHLDDKILTSWNGLMISAFAKGAQLLEDLAPERASAYRDAALRAFTFLQKNLFDDAGRLYRRWREGERAVEAFLDDYAAYIQALIDLYETTFDPAYLNEALTKMLKALAYFEDKESGGFFSTAEKSDLILRMKEDYDGAEPSGNAVMAMNLVRLSQYTGYAGLREAAEDLFRAFDNRISQQGPTVPALMSAWMTDLAPKGQVILAGPWDDPRLQNLLGEVRQHFLPFTAVMVASDDDTRARLETWHEELKGMLSVDGVPAAYVCQDFTCQLPVATVDALTELLH